MGVATGAGQRVVAHEIADERERLAQPFGHVGRDAYQHELGEPEREREGRQQRGCERVALGGLCGFRCPWQPPAKVVRTVLVFLLYRTAEIGE